MTTLARPTGRLAHLLNAMAASGESWTSGQVHRFYRRHVCSLASLPAHKVREVARGDLRDLAAWGHLTAHGPDNRRSYSLTNRTTGEPT
jgi:hypothetical protein